MTLYVAAPVALAVLLPSKALFPGLFAVTALGLYLLHQTRGFGWASLIRGRIHWQELLVFAGLTSIVSAGVMLTTVPKMAFFLVVNQPVLLATILVLYPVLSALPQEIVFRPLFFRRYGVLLPQGWPGIVLNAAIFSLAHLMFWNWIVMAMTFCGGIVFARAYQTQQSFPQAVLLHSVAGGIVFIFGLGMFFYSGNVMRPF